MQGQLLVMRQGSGYGYADDTAGGGWDAAMPPARSLCPLPRTRPVSPQNIPSNFFYEILDIFPNRDKLSLVSEFHTYLIFFIHILYLSKL
jgi:hypothetical protein